MTASRPLLDTLLRDGALASLTSTHTLEDFANNLYRLVGALRPGVVTTLLRVDRDNVLHPVGSTALPAEYDRAVDGLILGDGVGVCGTAAFRREPVLAHNEPDDPLWPVLVACGLPAEYGTCWSTPIVGATGEVVGTFAFYYPGHVTPSAADESVVNICADLCRLALERDRMGRDFAERFVVDPVTGLLYYDHAVGDTVEEAEQPVGVLLVEVDNHAAVSHTFDFAEGDRLLAEAARRIQSVLGRRLALLQRMRGAQFRLVLPATAHREMSRLAHEITQLGWGTTDAGSIDSSMTVGAALGPDDGQDVHALTRAASLALTEAKAGRPGTVQFFHTSMGHDAARRLELGSALRTAIDARHISLVYQPQVNLRTGALVGAEVLARWNGTSGQPVPPSLFVSIAEEIGLSRSLDQLVFELACAQLRTWDEAGLRVPRLSVNVSPVTLTSPALVPCAAAIIEEHRIDAERLTVEVIESRLVEERTGGRTLHNLHDLGFRISLDDFGTGYSSFAQLARLPIDEVKIDRSFVAEDTKGGADAPVATAILQIAQTFGQEVVAEGIESPMQRDLLREKGCPIGQGYLFSKPLSPEAFAAWASRVAA